MTPTLILDEQSVASAQGVAFHVNRADKHPENPVLLPGEPHQWDSLQVSWPGTVLYDEEERLFRCWYSGFDAVQAPERFWKPGYAESEDGVHWRKPELGQVSYLDRPTNQINIGWENVILSCVFVNPASDAPPSQRYGALFTEWARDAGEGFLRKSLAWSPDGLQWTRAGHAFPVTRPGADFQDISQLLFQPEAADPDQRVVGYAQCMVPRSWDGCCVRQIGRVHGPDPAHLVNDEPMVVLAPEEGIDEELHFASVNRVGDNWLMLYESDRFAHNPIHGDLRLAVSPDGKQFRRVHATEPLLATGAKGMWDENLLVTSTATIQEVGDTLYLFYFGCPNIYNSWPAAYAVTALRRGSMFYPAYMGLATLPRDQYAYAAGPGTLTTPPCTLTEGELWVNADGNELTVVALNAAGQPLARGRLTDERRRTVYRRVAWDAAPPTGEASLRFELGTGVRLYSYQGTGSVKV